MLEIDLNNILPEEDALQKITDIFAKVENDKETYILTKDGRPVLAIIDIDHLEQNIHSVGIATSDDDHSLSEVTSPPMPTPAPQPVLNMPATDAQPSVAMMDNVTLPTAEPASTIDTPLPTSFASSATESYSAPMTSEPQSFSGTISAQPTSAPEAAPTEQPAPVAVPTETPLPSMSGSLDLPDMPEDPTNSSPLA